MELIFLDRIFSQNWGRESILVTNLAIFGGDTKPGQRWVGGWGRKLVCFALDGVVWYSLVCYRYMWPESRYVLRQCKIWLGRYGDARVLYTVDSVASTLTKAMLRLGRVRYYITVLHYCITLRYYITTRNQMRVAIQSVCVPKILAL